MPRFSDPWRAILVLLALCPRAVIAQTEPGSGEQEQVGAALSLRAGLSWLSGKPLPIAALAGTVRLSTTFELGGEGVVGLRSVRLSPGDTQNQTEMETGYGGILLRWRPAGDMPGIRWTGALLLGAGAARVRSPLSNTPVITENYFLLEPRLHLGVAQNRPIRFHGDAGYRIALGADPLPGISATELRGATLSLALQYVHGP